MFAATAAGRAKPGGQLIWEAVCAVGTEVGLSIGAIKPEYKLDPGFPEHLRLSPRVVNGPGARFREFFFTGPHADDRTRRGR